MQLGRLRNAFLGSHAKSDGFSFIVWEAIRIYLWEVYFLQDFVMMVFGYGYYEFCSCGNRAIHKLVVIMVCLYQVILAVSIKRPNRSGCKTSQSDGKKSGNNRE